MSTLAYAALTTRRDQAPSTTTASESKRDTDVNGYVDAMSALVPAEVLSAHAIILSYTTTTAIVVKDGITLPVVSVTAPTTLRAAFIVLLALSSLLYLVPRLTKPGVGFRSPIAAERWIEAIRVALPAVAFVVWTMLQKATAFDAVWPAFHETPRTVIAVVAALVLLQVAGWLTKQSDRREPQS